MLSRRELIAGGAAVHMAAGGAAAAQRETSDDGPRARFHSGGSERNPAGPYGADGRQSVSSRTQQRHFFRLNQRFPQCIDVGIRVWERMQDWHIAHLTAADHSAHRRRPLADGLHHVGDRAEARAA